MTIPRNLSFLADGASSTGVLSVPFGGTGLTSTPANGALDIGNGTGFTRTTITAGSGISVTNGAGSITIASSGGSGTVTSVATGNGLSGGTITTSGTLIIAAPTYQSVGSYMGLYSSSAISANTNYSGSNARVQNWDGSGTTDAGNASGTYRCLGVVSNNGAFYVAVRVS
jgi:hypothetical protein